MGVRSARPRPRRSSPASGRSRGGMPPATKPQAGKEGPSASPLGTGKDRRSWRGREATFPPTYHDAPAHADQGPAGHRNGGDECSLLTNRGSLGDHASPYRDRAPPWLLPNACLQHGSLLPGMSAVVVKAEPQMPVL